MPADRPTLPLLIMHIPKTAGTTLAWVAARQYPPGALYTLYPGHYTQFEALAAAVQGPTPPLAAVGHFRFGLHDRLPLGAKYLTFLRHPVDHVVSMYNYLAASPDPAHRAVLPPGAGMDELIAHEWGGNLQTQYVTGLTRAEVDADPGGAYRRAVDNLSRHFVGVGVAERFAASLRLVAGRVGWWVPAYPWLNRAADRPGRIRRAELSPALEERVRRANACDVRLYRYVRAAVLSELRASPGVRLRVGAAAVVRRLASPPAGS